ncbi:uncharacterized protein CXQ87_004590 [Candidozyma duobushaemuli]|uniref:NADP-dependent oxidoreductase domain-containing protein n=2 Tax=Candidozyma TaxID=3303203 RepID=A0ABX8I9R9_9ASCO|nr:uncharacterized protein CXQ87_004590 [[Candida] duobushaemulonis]PVH17031.1 hypothetical protein CXQ87_004590 [[Candida] duobushaemulonis]QWU89797.1 hypothetical protein CA3LBN_004145 [[Candida] haemuloni]
MSPTANYSESGPRPNYDYYQLNDGNRIPAIGLGTYKVTDADEARKSVKTALQAGYRHIDTASRYKNEEQVGEGIRESGVPREEVFVTTKLWNADHHDPEGALNESLRKLGLDYIDLYLIHYPVNLEEKVLAQPHHYDFLETYKEMQKLVHSGKAKSIGVSNFTKERVELLINDPGVSVKPVVNQIEAHPLLTQPDLKEFCDENDILIEAFSPLGSASSPLFENPVVKAVAENNGATAGQVLVSWALQRNTVVLPKSVKEERIISNMKTFTLSEADFEALNNLSAKFGVQRTCNFPWGVFN